MGFYNIHKSLDDHLKTLSTLPPLQEENIRKSLGAGTKSWCRSTFLPDVTRRLSLGIGGMDEKFGIYQIDVFYPGDDHYQLCQKMTDTIIDHFKIGQIIDSIRVMNVYQAPGYSGAPNYYTIPVIVEWSYFDNRPII